MTADPNANPTATPHEAPRLVDLPTKPSQPIVLRPVGCDAEMIGMNTDCFTLGSVDGVDAPIPAAWATAGQPIKLRFIRAAEGWRVTLVEGPSLYVNQTPHQGASPLRAGDVLRLSPGGPGLQFMLTHGKAESVGRLAARYAPRLLAGSPDASGSTAPADRSRLALPGGQAIRWGAGLVIVLVAILAALVVWSLVSEPTRPPTKAPPSPSSQEPDPRP